MTELAWGHLMDLKGSSLTAWFWRRTSDARRGTRKTMVVALARKLLITVAARGHRRDAGRSAASPAE
jgi:transposase